MNKKILLYIILLIFIINIVQGLEFNNSYSILNVSNCYDNLTIKVRQLNNVNDYKFNNCYVKNNYWICKCNKNNTELILKTLYNTNNIYDFVIEYKFNNQTFNYTAGNLTPNVITDDVVRTVNINNFNVEYNKIIKKTSFLSDFKIKNLKNFLVLFIIIIIISIIYFIKFIKSFFFINTKTQKQKQNNNIITYDDMIILLNKYKKQ